MAIWVVKFLGGLQHQIGCWPKIKILKKIIVFEKQQLSHELSKIVHHLITLVDC